VICRSVAAIDLLSVVDAWALSGAIVKKCKIFLGRRGNFFAAARRARGRRGTNFAPPRSGCAARNAFEPYGIGHCCMSRGARSARSPRANRREAGDERREIVKT
jgi:hypothetical protein